MSFLDLSNVKDEKKFDVLPAGNYLFKCQSVEIKETKAGTGKYIKAKLREQKSGTTLFHNFNIENPNAKAVEIGLSQLKSFLKGANYSTPEDLKELEDLIGLKCWAKTKVRSSHEYGDSAEISYFKTKPEEDTDNIPF